MLSDVIWKNGPWNTSPLLNCATMVPWVPDSVQLKFTPTLWPTTWPVPKPVVVQAAAASAINEAPASLIEKAFILLLLYSCRYENGGVGYLLPWLNDSLRRCNPHAAKFMFGLPFPGRSAIGAALAHGPAVAPVIFWKTAGGACHWGTSAIGQMRECETCRSTSMFSSRARTLPRPRSMRSRKTPPRLSKTMAGRS